MTDKPSPDPLEGFHFDAFEPETKTLTIRIQELIVKHPKQKNALIEKINEVLSFGDQIDKVIVKPRE